MISQSLTVYQQAVFCCRETCISPHRVLLVKLHFLLFLPPALLLNTCQPQLKIVVLLAQVVEEVAQGRRTP